MDIENFIEWKYQELQPYINLENIDLYGGIKHSKLKEIFATLHYMFLSMYKLMNDRLPTDVNTAHFWADSSRELILAIDISISLQRTLKDSEYAFEIEPYYANLIFETRKFLSKSNGSEIPPHMDQVNLYYTTPVFIPKDLKIVNSPSGKKSYNLILIGEGSYAVVYKYHDTYYQTWFVVKRAKKDLTDKELARFKREFEQMREFHSPYIVKVYCYNNDLNEYTMEFMDSSLDQYITTNNDKLIISSRKSIANQLLHAFQYIHSKSLLHRDISPKNILINLFDDVPVVKVADFGLVEIPDSTLTTVNTDFKGYYNDPALILEGFDNYSIVHETYAITRLLYFIMTGKTNMEKINDQSLKNFVEKGLSPDKAWRYQSVDELIKAFQRI
ncbi:protein kinase domain [Longilinea arvoryzae]|uniref:mitogen-activated protein kinase kinase n=1 Tax=Longilinea arvoryzae TaxID=360412 RepID=A0A0S7BKV2_9CHLR|nr:protein kinase family protein [Longilinea arvoryzae]GAP14481.1 protein kinase domain [Longilinea arvoryzae]